MGGKNRVKKVNYHTHTKRCKHAGGSDEEYIESAIKSGFQELGFADHTPWPFDSSYTSSMRMDIEQLDDYVNHLQILKQKYVNQISIKIGLECEYFEEYIPWLRHIIEEYKVDYVIFGNHFSSNEQKNVGYGKMKTDETALELYLNTAIKAIESKLFAYFAHPDIFIRGYGKFDDVCERISRQICEKAKEYDLILEFNISNYICEPDSKHYLYPCLDFWKIVSELGCRCIIGYDAHQPQVLEQQNGYLKAIAELEKIGIEIVDVIPFLNHL